MKNYLVLFLTFALLSSCEKESIDPLDILTDGSVKFWKLSSYMQNDKSLLTDCFKDDTFTFNKTKGEYLWLKGGSKCDKNDSDEKYTFILSEDYKTITFNGAKWEVISLSKSAFEIRTSEFSDKVLTLKYVPV